MAQKSSIPLSVWYKTIFLLIVLVASTTLYDQHYKKTNPYINVVRDRLTSSTKELDKPLVVTIGASLEMLATPKEWQNDEFQWLRVIIQGSQLDDYVAVADDVIAAKPDLVVIGLHQFIDKPYSQHLREAFKRLLRAPLESAGFIRSRINQHEISRCTSSFATTDEVIDHVQNQFKTPNNTLLSGKILKTILSNGIPVVILRTPMLEEVELQATNRNQWLKTAYQDADSLGIKIIDTSWQLDEAYFCRDKQHSNPRGELKLTEWLKPVIIEQLESLK